MTSSNRSGELPLHTGNFGREDSAAVDAGESAGVPRADDQQTVISNRSPLSPGSGDVPIGIEPGGLKPGDMLGDYEILAFVGGGGMGRVYRARDAQLGRQVALKVLPAAQIGDMETVLRFRNEARSAARLDHESIARVYHVGEDRGIPYLVFEFVEGPTVRTLVEQHGPLPLPQAISYTLQVADALVHADQRDVVHRDIKPSNMIIMADGRVKLIDMGLARIQRLEESATDLTASGVTLGTFDYISPEQARDPRVVDTRSDIYSLGCAFFFMLSGRPPFPEGTVLQKLLQHQGDKPPEIGEFRPELPEDVSRVLRKMLAKDPSNRYQTPMELVEQLQFLAEQIGLRPLGPAQRIWLAPKPRPVPLLQRHLPWLAPLAALLCIVVAIDFLSTGETEPPLPRMQEFAMIPAEETIDALPPPEPTPSANFPAGAVGNSPRSPRVPTGESVGEANGVRSATSRLPSDEAPASSRDGAVWHDVFGERSTLPSLDAGMSPLDGVVTGVNETIDPALLAEGLASPDPLWSSPTTPMPAPTRGSGVLTVGIGASGANDFPTLAAACAAARTGDIIELCFDERREERPFDVPNVKLTIRARQGYRPVIVFRPDEDDPVTYPRRMITLPGGDVTLVNVAIEMDIPPELPAGQWVLWEMERAASLRLRQSSLTVRNGLGHDVTVFRARPSPETDRIGSTREGEPAAPTEIEIDDCVIRGRATIVRAEGLQPVQLAWNNGLLVTDQWFLWAQGGDRDAATGDAIVIRLKHLTGVVGQGLCRLDNSRLAPARQLPVRVDCSDSLLLVTSPQGALIELLGEYPHNLQEWFTWTGDRNGYSGSTVFHRMDDLTYHLPPEVLDFQEWQNRWPGHDIHSRWGRIDFAGAIDSGRSPDSFTAADFRLTDSRENWARGGASDGNDLGAALDRLPAVPLSSGAAAMRPEPREASP
ncbi:MAG: serine/threonine protein kinase [Pirellulaceae bacterium]|nr:serine/threonine protein kinase [Pirellulaceae bacterium]